MTDAIVIVKTCLQFFKVVSGRLDPRIANLVCL
jgi:hypothetical protein